jgi:hypothetical protein
MTKFKTVWASVVAASIVAVLLSLPAIASFTGTPVVVETGLDQKDLEVVNYSGSGVGSGTITQRFDRETYRAFTLEVVWTPGAGDTLALTWEEKNDAGDITAAGYFDVTNERFGTATIAASGLFSSKTDVRSVSKFVEINAVVVDADSSADLDFIVRAGW